MYINIVLMFFLYAGLSGMLCSNGKLHNNWARAMGVGSMHFPLVRMNRLNKTESAFSYIVGSLYFRIICVLVNYL